MSATSPGGTSIHAQDQAKALWVAPVYLAGEEHDGGTRVVLPLLLDRSWTVASIRDDNVIVDSPCRRVRIGYMPTMPGYEARWVINASVDPLEPRHWQAAFDHGTPGEIVAAFTETVARDLESGNDRSLISDRNPDTALAVLRTAAWSQSRDPHGTGTELVPEELRYHDQLFTSPDGMASVRRRVRPARSWAEEIASGPEMWEFTAGVPGATWRGTVTSAAPSHLVAAVTRTLTSSMAVYRNEEELVPLLRPHLVVGPNPASAPSLRAGVAQAAGRRLAMTPQLTVPAPSPVLTSPAGQRARR